MRRITIQDVTDWKLGTVSGEVRLAIEAEITSEDSLVIEFLEWAGGVPGRSTPRLVQEHFENMSPDLRSALENLSFDEDDEDVPKVRESIKMFPELSVESLEPRVLESLARSSVAIALLQNPLVRSLATALQYRGKAASTSANLPSDAIFRLLGLDTVDNTASADVKGHVVKHSLLISDHLDEEDEQLASQRLLQLAEQIHASVREKVHAQSWRVFWQVCIEGWTIRQTADALNLTYQAAYGAHARVSKRLAKEIERQLSVEGSASIDQD